MTSSPVSTDACLKLSAAQWLALSPVQQTALESYDAGFNVLPIPRVRMEYNGRKPPYGKYGLLFATRLHRAYLPELFDRANIAVICGRLSHNLFVVDCDTEREFKRVGQELKKRGIVAWVTVSARGGHYWLLCAEGEIKTSKLSETLEIIGAHGYILIPPSVHPTGTIYEWLHRDGDLPPTVSIDALDFLLGIELVRRREGDLPLTARRVLVEHDTRKYHSNSEAEFAAVMALAKAGWGDDEIIEVFEKYQPPHFARKRNPAGWLRRYMLPKARKNTETSDRRTHTDTRAAWALSRPWPGRTGETDRAVYLGLCKRARLDRRIAFRAASRELAALANLSRRTVTASLHRLIASKLIERAGSDSLSRASLFRFTDLPSQPLGVSSPLYPCSDSGLLTPNSDAWHRQALSKTGLAVYRALLVDGDMAAGQLCQRTGRSMRAVKRALAKLNQFGLTTVIGELWAAEPGNSATFDGVARACGTGGKTAKRIERYMMERAVHVSRMLIKQKRAWEARNAESHEKESQRGQKRLRNG